MTALGIVLAGGASCIASALLTALAKAGTRRLSPARHVAIWTTTFWGGPLLFLTICVIASAAPEPRDAFPLSPLPGVQMFDGSLAAWGVRLILSAAALWSLTKLSRLTCAVRQVRSLTRRAIRCALQVGDDEVTSVLLSDEITSPLLVGVYRTAVMLPRSAARSWSREQLALACRHEAAHRRHYDNLALLLERIVLAIFPFSKALHASHRHLLASREIRCDREALRSVGLADRRAYASALIGCLHRSPVMASSYGGQSGEIRQRIELLLNPAPADRGIGAAFAIAASITLIFLLSQVTVRLIDRVDIGLALMRPVAVRIIPASPTARYDGSLGHQSIITFERNTNDGRPTLAPATITTTGRVNMQKVGTHWVLSFQQKR